jgi:hypothetical protein
MSTWESETLLALQAVQSVNILCSATQDAGRTYTDTGNR